MIKMLGIYNFLSIESIELEELDSMNVIGIIGSFEEKEGYSNASGKSAFAESIYFAFTGKHRYKTDIEVIRIGENEAKVILVSINKKNELYIERTLKKKSDDRSTSSALIVKLNDEIVASSTREGQEYINKYFSITPNDFIASYFFRQKEYDVLMRAKSSKRIEFIQKFFKSYIFDEAKKLSSKSKSEMLNKLKVFEGMKHAIREEKSGITSLKVLKSNISKIKKVINEIKENKKEKEHQLIVVEKNIEKEKAKNVEVEIRLKKIKEIVSEISNLKNSLSKLEIDISKHCRRKVKLEREKKECIKKLKKSEASKNWTEKDELILENLKDRIDNLLVKIDISRKTEEIFLTNIKNLNYGICPIYSQECPIYSQNKNIKEEQVMINENKIKDLKNSRKLDEDLINSLEEKLKLKKDEKKVRKSFQGIRSSLNNEIEKLRLELKANMDMNNVLTKHTKDIKNTISDLVRERSELGILRKSDSLDIMEREKEKVKSDILSCDVKIREKTIELHKKSELCKHLIGINNKLNSIRNKEKKVRLSISDRFLIEDIFEKCKLEIISEGINELENHSNSIIKEVGAVHKMIVFEKSRETQKGEIKDSLDIYLVDEKGKRAIEGLSGGEWDLCAFSFRASLARYKLSRMSSIIDFMILDEIFGALDEPSREELISVINMLRSDFSQIFVITHTNLKEAFDNILHVEMGKDGITRLKN